MLLQVSPAKRELYRTIDEHMTRQGPVKDPKALEAKAKKKIQAKQATLAVMDKFRTKAKEAVKGSSRMEVFESLVVLSAGAKKSAKAKAKAKAKKNKKDSKAKAGMGIPKNFLLFNPPL